MRVIRGREADTPSENRTSTFTGTVWADVLLGGEQGVTVNNVWFGPRSRTYWHTHDVGQILHGHRRLGLRRDARRRTARRSARATSRGSPRARSTGTAARPTPSCCTPRPRSARRTGSTRSPRRTTTRAWAHERAVRRGHEGPPRGARRRVRRPVPAERHRVPQADAGARHRVLLGRRVGPAGPGPQDAQPREPGDAVRAEPLHRARARTSAAR